MKVKNTLKSLGAFTLCVLKTPLYLPQDRSLAGEIKDYVDVIKRASNPPQWDYCLNVLKTEYKPIGLFSHAASCLAAEEIEKERKFRELKKIVEPEIMAILPEKIAVKQA